MIKQTLGLATILASVAIACADTAPPDKKVPPPPPPPAAAAKPVEATAAIDPRSGSTVTGTARFVEESGSVTLTLNVEHAPPGEHAVHLHETGALILTTDKWSIGTGDTGDILGHAVIVHEKADDFKTQPTGAAGGRIGCGVVRR